MSNPFLSEIIEQQMHVLVGRDGSPQLSTLAPDPETCVAVIKLMHKKGFGRSFFDLTQSGFEIRPVIVTIKLA